MLSDHAVHAVSFLRGLGVQGSDDAISKLLNARFGLRLDETHLRLVAQVALEVLDGQADRFDRRADQHRFLEALVYALLDSETPDYVWDLFGPRSELSYHVLGMRRGDFERGRRMMQAVLDHFHGNSPEDRPWAHSAGVYLSHDLALFEIERGYLPEAESRLRALIDGGTSIYYQSTCGEDLCDVLLLAGRLPEAEQVADEVAGVPVTATWGIGDAPRRPVRSLADCVRAGQQAMGTPGSNPFARRAAARALQGKSAEALADFKRAEAFQRGKMGEAPFPRGDRLRRDPGRQELPLAGPGALHYADLLVRLGKLDSAEAVAMYHVWWGRSAFLPLIEAHAALILSDIARLRGVYRRAARWLDYPAAWARRTGQQALDCRAGLAEARLKLAQGQLDAAHRAASAARRIANRCGFRLYEVDTLTTLGRINLERGNTTEAKRQAQAALRLAEDRTVQYGWGRGGALHLLGEIALAGFHREPAQAQHLAEARQYLAEAADLRRAMRDPRWRNTQRILDALPER